MKKYIPVILLLSLLITGCSSIHEHKYIPANYQSPATCSICGKTQGFALEPEFEMRKLETNMEFNVEYDYNTVCSKDETFTTVGKAIITKDEIIVSDETHPAKDGYNYHIVVLQLTFSDFNSNEYGFKYNYFTTDFYSIEDFTESYSYNSDKQVNEFTVNYNGTDYPCTLNTVITKTDWKKNAEGTYTKVITLTQEYLVPENYDGLVLGIRDSSIDVSNTQFIHQYYDVEKFLLYRLGGNGHE